MASPNLDLVRSIFVAWERGDFTSVDWADPEIEFVVPDGPEPGTVTGVAAMAASTRDYLRAWEDFRWFVDEYRDLDRQRVFVLAHGSARGKASGLDSAQQALRRRGALRD
jgi:ketosteroid isomerase-like protein